MAISALARRILPCALVCVMIGLYLRGFSQVPDMQNYLCWARASSTADIQQIDPTAELSVNGVPFCHWSPGPGLMLAPFYAAMKWFDQETLEPTIIRIAAGFYSLAFWCLIYHCLREAFGNSRQYVALGLLVLLSCTAIGYYSLALGSESLSLLPVAVLMFQTIRFVQDRPQNWLIVGCATALLIMNRPYLVPFAGPALLGLGFELKNRASVVRPWLCVFLPIAMGLAVMMTHHYWMTGNIFRSPYSFGDEQFHSLDLRNPQYFGSVLFDPFHGALSTHPFVAVGMIALTIAGLKAAWQHHWRLSLAVGAALLAVAINVWFVSSWYYWWLGIPHLANRGIVLPGLPATLGFLVWLRHSHRQWIPTTALLFCAVWSLPHQLMGPTHYETWYRLWEGQLGRYLDLFTSSEGLILGLAAILAALAMLLQQTKPSIRELFKPLPLGLVSLFAFSVLFLHATTRTSWPATLVPLAFLAATAYCLFEPWLRRAGSATDSSGVADQAHAPDSQVSRFPRGLQWVVPATFLLSVLFFTPLAWNTSQILERPEHFVEFYYSDAEGGMRYVAASDRSDFQALSKRFQDFCEREGLPMRPPLDRRVYTYELARQIQANPSLFTLFKGD